MADNPNQIDISLSLLGSDSPAVLTALTQTLQSIAETMEGVKSALPEGSWKPVTLNTAAGDSASRPEAGPSPADAPSQPSRAPDAQFFETYSQSPSVTQPDYSAPAPAPGPYDDTWARKKLNPYREENPKSDEPFLPRVGQKVWDTASNAVDVLTQKVGAGAHQTGGFFQAMKDDTSGLTSAMASSMWDDTKQFAGNVWAGLRGTDKGQDLTKFEQGRNLAINLAGAPWVMQNVEKFLPSTLPLLMHPNQMNQFGGQTGRDTKGATVGPFQIPFTSEATGFAATEALRTAWEGLKTPGLSGKDLLNVKKNLTALGWGSNEQELDTMTKTLKPILQTEKGLDTGTVTAMMDKSMRWGGHSLSEFQKTIYGIGHAARAAHMDINEFTKAISDAGGTAATMGADYLTGVKNARDFSAHSGLPPQLYGQFLQNPWMQAQLMGQTGALPWEQGLLSPDTVMMGGIDVANMLTKTFENARPNGITYQDASGRKRHISSFEAGTAGAANVLGMSPQELRSIERNKNLLPARGRAWDDVDAYAKEANNPQAWNRLTKDVMAGHFTKGNKGVSDKLHQIYESTKGHPQARAHAVSEALTQWMKDTKFTQKDPNAVTVSLAGDAARYLRLNTPKQRSKTSVNAGGAATANSSGMPGSPSPDTFDPNAASSVGGSSASPGGVGYW